LIAGDSGIMVEYWLGASARQSGSEKPLNFEFKELSTNQNFLLQLTSEEYISLFPFQKKEV
jgi:hypothetical protein